MNDDAYNALYRAALKADDDYEAAIKAQYGARACRFDNPASKHNSATAAARDAKLALDKMWLDAMRKRGV